MFQTAAQRSIYSPSAVSTKTCRYSQASTLCSVWQAPAQDLGQHRQHGTAEQGGAVQQTAGKIAGDTLMQACEGRTFPCHAHLSYAASRTLTGRAC